MWCVAHSVAHSDCLCGVYVHRRLTQRHPELVDHFITLNCPHGRSALHAVVCILLGMNGLEVYVYTCSENIVLIVVSGALYLASFQTLPLASIRKWPVR